MCELTKTTIEHLMTKGASIRRVYVLPLDLHARVLNYMAATGTETEVEAVRRLLSDELNNHETPEQTYSRLATMHAEDAVIAACGHPQVEGLRWAGKWGDFAVVLRNGQVLQFVDGFASTEALPVKAVL